MNIRSLRFKNLNSLYGEWFIDFTTPEYAADGIFSITGPTGAGKSTILDAICLALYARTPRLASVNQSGNEIMSRQTGECFSEVVFETRAGSFRATWSQHRAYRKPDGRLAEASHELAEARTGTLIETRKREMPSVVEGITGMDFDRFTRSMLLAQGGFAAFLQAAPDQRAPILEQITGTEVYSRISIHVHETLRAARETLKQMQDQTHGIRMLTSDEEETIRRELAAVTHRRQSLEAEQAELDKAVAWLTGIRTMEDRLRSLEADKVRLDKEIRQFDDRRRQLDAALRAANLEGPWSALVSLRRLQEQDSASLAASNQRLPAEITSLSTADKAMEEAQKHRDSLAETASEQTRLIWKVRVLDERTAEKNAASDKVRKVLRTLETDTRNTRGKLDALKEKLAGTLRELAVVSDFLARHAGDAALASDLEGLCEKLDLLSRAENREQALKKTVSRLESDAAAAERTASDTAAVCQDLATRKQKTADALARASETILAGLDGRRTADLRADLEELRGKAALLDRMSDLHEAMLSDTRAMEETRAGLADTLKRIEALAAEQKSLETETALLEKRISLLETEEALRQRIQYLETERSRLEDNAPCPLCGSLDHPWARGNIPQPGPVAQDLARTRSELKAATSRQSLVAGRLAEQRSLADQARRSIDERSKSVQKNQRQFADQAERIGLCLTARLPETGLTKEISSIRKEIASLSDRLAEIDALESRARELESALLTLSESLLEKETKRQQAESRASQIREAIARSRAEQNDAVREIQDLTALLTTRLRPYGTPSIQAPDRQATEALLRSRLTHWQDNQDNEQRLKTARADLSAEIAGLESRLSEQEKHLSDQRQAARDLTEVMARLADERRGLFGDKDADREEQRLADQLKQAETGVAEAGRRQAEARQEVQEIRSRIQTLETAIDRRREEIDRQETGFTGELSAEGFGSEAAFLEARLPRQERDQLAAEANLLDRRALDLDSRIRDLAGQLTGERGKKVTDQTRETLSAQRTRISTDLDTAARTVGALEQKLTENEKARAVFLEKQRQIDRQTLECHRWEALHTLIGSADGKKFRNFAQGLTFEILVAHANQQLAAMSDRYLLVPDPERPLELSVMDNYQAGEIRSTKNLSGGESFIVSLALALGLSGMASQRVRVDCLFLDEGFGTLDQDALETALESLAGLHRQGKLIGIISHVSALKERISTQIRVTPVSGGKSVLTGPGCRRSTPAAGRD